MTITAQFERTIYRAEHSKSNPYTVISNTLLRDDRIKRADKGLLVELLSWGDKHRVCVAALIKKGKEGRDAIQGMLNRLEDVGYIKKIQLKNDDGTFGKVVYQIYESPVHSAVVATIEDDKQPKEISDEYNPQMGFEFDTDMKNDTDTQPTANGFSVNGEPETNKYYKEISNSNNSNCADVVLDSVFDSKDELLKKWHLKIDDGALQARLVMAGIQSIVATQEQLDRYLIDFNQHHDQYKHLRADQRFKNFILFLVKIHNSAQGQRTHLARLRAIGMLPSHHVQKSSNTRKASNFDRYFLTDAVEEQSKAVEIQDKPTNFDFSGF